MLLTEKLFKETCSNLKYVLEEKTGFLFRKDVGEEFAFKLQEEMISFYVDYDFEHALFSLYFKSVFWEKADRTLEKKLTHLVIDYLKEKKINCFFTVESSTYFEPENYMESTLPELAYFDYLPIGETSLRVLELMADLPIRKSVFQKNLFVSEPIYHQTELEVIPKLDGRAGIALYQTESSNFPLGKYDQEHLIAVIHSVDEYEEFRSKKKEAEALKEAIFTYINSFSIDRNALFFDVYLSLYDELCFSFLRKYAIRSFDKEYLFSQAKQIVAASIAFEQSLQTFLQRLSSRFPATFYINNANVNNFCSRNYEVYLDDQLTRLEFSFVPVVDTFSGTVSFHYSLTFKKETTHFHTVEELFSTTMETFKKEDNQSHIRNLYKPNFIPHLARLHHEFSTVSAILPDELVGEAKMTLEHYFNDEHRAPMNTNIGIPNCIGTLRITKKNPNIIKIEKAG